MRDSLRFNPPRDSGSGKAVCGLIQLMCDIGSLNKYNPMKIAEIGNHCGESTLIILYCVDKWRPPEIIKRLECMQNIKNKNVIFLNGDSVEQSEKIQDNSLDMVYIDAAHDYDSVMADLNAWYPKVKSGGFICGHDYHDVFGVKKAVGDFNKNYNLKIKIYMDASFLMQK
jgi:predicted O-methyltransferase YrrM